MDSYKQIYTNWKPYTWKWVNGTTNCKEEQECEITSKMFSEKPSFLKKYELHSITFYTKEKWVQVLIRFTYQFTLSKNFKLFRYKI
jgi:hypothetical protein